MKMSRSRLALLAVGGIAAGTASIGYFGPTLEGMVASIVLGSIWGATVALVLGPEA